MDATISHTVYGGISKERLEEISGYRTSDISAENFSDPATWETLKDILLYHPSPVTRHEAAFLMPQLDPETLILCLVPAVKYDESIVVKHEAIEALGKVRGPEAGRAYKFLKKILDTETKRYDEGLYHPDVQATAREAVRDLEEYLFSGEGKRWKR